MDVSEVEKAVPEVTAGRGSPMLKGNVDRGTAGVQSKGEERMARTTGSRRSAGSAKTRVRSGKASEEGNRLTNIPELIHLGNEIDIFA